MKYTFDKTKALKSTSVNEEYFPIIILFSSDEIDNRFLEYSYLDSDMFEFVISKKFKYLRQFTFTLCNHFKIINDKMVSPKAEEGTLYISDTKNVETSNFLTSIYEDGIHVYLEESSAIKHLKCGQLIFSFDKDDELTDLYITNLTTTDINHFKTELLD